MKNIETFDLFEMSKISSIEYTEFVKNFFINFEKNIEKDLSAIFSKKVVFSDKNYSLLNSEDELIDTYIADLNFDNSIDIIKDKFCADYHLNFDKNLSMNIVFLITDKLCTIESIYFSKLKVVKKPGQNYDIKHGEVIEIQNNLFRSLNYAYDLLLKTIKKDSKKFN